MPATDTPASRHHDRRALNLLRIVVALLLVVHGAARLGLGIVDDFGGYLDEVGFPLGHVLAWTITVMELAGGTLLAFGRWTRPLAFYFAAQLTLGIVLVHAQEGWFVVGAGRNGVEYSVLLITVLLAVGYAAFERHSEPQNSSLIDDDA